MSYNALARKYRPSTFADVVGQGHVVGTLRAALRKDKLSHAYLFSGPRGCGKTTLARLLAKALNCTSGAKDDPCGVCETCQAIAAGSYLDVLEIDAASNTGVDNIRDLRDMAQYTPVRGGYRVFIIDEVHMLSKGAFNALLKILEEPPARVFFFFATTEPNKIPRTILSRCQRFDFRLLTRVELSARIESVAAAEGARIEPAALAQIVSLAEGSMRDALSVLDQLVAACDGAIDEKLVIDLFGLVQASAYTELNEAILAHDPARALRLADHLLREGQSLDAFAHGIAANFRNLLLLRVDPGLGDGLDLAPEQRATLTRQAELFSAPDLLALLDRAGMHYERIHRSTQPRVLLEAALVEYALFESRVLLADLARRLEALVGGKVPPGLTGMPAGGSRSGRAPTRPAGGSGGRHAAAPEGTAADAAPTPRTGAAETVTGWSAFVETLLRTEPRLGACLMEALPSLDEARGRLVLAFPAEKEFQIEQVRQELPVLRERVAAFFGRPLIPELLAGDSRPDGGLREAVRRRVAPTEREALEAACRTDTSLAGLVNLLDADPIAEAERAAWTRRPAAAEPLAGPDDGVTEA